ncbi:hypothetical protein DV738_g2782, partial [Chaetothyriales sp. CBS 135597]
METNDKFEPEWIWIDDEGSNVYAQGYGRSRTVIFSFSADNHNPPTSLGNRVCTKYEGIETKDEAATFPTIKDMRDAIWGAIRHVWPRYLSHPGLGTGLDTVVAVDSIDSSIEKVTWKVYSHPLFPRFIQNLASESHFRTALQHSDNNESDDEFFRHLIRNWWREYNTLQQLPPHPNVLRPPQLLATIQWPSYSASPVFCGALFPFYPGGSVASRIEDSNKKGVRIPLLLKAHWCADMATAVFHTHRIAKTYHKDIKPGNFVADASDNLILCDWELLDAPATTLAPEADGTWDVSEDGQDGRRPRLQYTKYSGIPRRNVDEGILADAPWHTWNVFPVWNATCPWALELAEVFSLGRSMWMLVRQPEMEFEDIEHPEQLVTDWNNSEDIPIAWKQLIDRCMSRDPNERPDLSDLVDFWTKERNAQKVANGDD